MQVHIKGIVVCPCACLEENIVEADCQFMELIWEMRILHALSHAIFR